MATPKEMMTEIVRRLDDIKTTLDARLVVTNAEMQMRLETLSSKLDLMMTLHTQPVVAKKAPKKAEKKKEDTKETSVGAGCDIAALVLEDEKTKVQDETPYPHIQNRWPLARPQKKQSGINRVMYFNRAYDNDPETFSEYVTPDVKKNIAAEFKRELEEKKTPEERRLFLRQKYYRYMATNHSAKLIYMKNQYNADILAKTKVLAVKETAPAVSIPNGNAAVKKEYDLDTIVNSLEADAAVGDDDVSGEEYEDEEDDA